MRDYNSVRFLDGAKKIGWSESEICLVGGWLWSLPEAQAPVNRNSMLEFVRAVDSKKVSLPYYLEDCLDTSWTKNQSEAGGLIALLSYGLKAKFDKEISAFEDVALEFALFALEKMAEKINLSGKRVFTVWEIIEMFPQLILKKNI